MIGRLSAQAAALVTRSQATGQAPVAGAAPAAVPLAGTPSAARKPAAAGARPTRGGDEARASPAGTTAKYRTVFACASHAQDTPTEEQRS